MSSDQMLFLEVTNSSQCFKTVVLSSLSLTSGHTHVTNEHDCGKTKVRFLIKDMQ